MSPLWKALSVSILVHAAFFSWGRSDRPDTLSAPDPQRADVLTVRVAASVRLSPSPSEALLPPRERMTKHRSDWQREGKPDQSAPAGESVADSPTARAWSGPEQDGRARTPGHASPVADTGRSNNAALARRTEELPASMTDLSSSKGINPETGSALPSPEDIRWYRMRVATIAAKFKEYPSLARERGWEGVVGIRIRLQPDRPQAEVSLASSSGIPVLDSAALGMISRASRAIEIPNGLRGRIVDVELPVDYRLD